MTGHTNRALDQARKEAARYLDQFTGLKERLSIEWERDANGGTDGNRKTIQCNQRNGKDDYYEYSIPLPYGEYVIEEQMPSDLEKNWQTGIIRLRNQGRSHCPLCRRSYEMRIPGKKRF